MRTKKSEKTQQQVICIQNTTVRKKGILSDVDGMKDSKCHIVSQTHTCKNTIMAPCESQQPGTPPDWVTCAGYRMGVLSEE